MERDSNIGNVSAQQAEHKCNGYCFPQSGEIPEQNLIDFPNKEKVIVDLTPSQLVDKVL